MKKIKSLSFLLLPIIVFSQTTDKEFSLNCIANWQKGESKILNIKRNKDGFESGKIKSTFEFLYEAHISIVDSSKDGYKVQWVFHLPEEFKKANPGIAEAMPVYEGLKMIFTTSTFGEFKDLLNWEEVKDAYVAMMYQSIPKEMDDSTKALMDKTIDVFNSKQMVETTLIKEIQLYHLPYGAEFSMNGIKGSTLQQNPLGGAPLPSSIVQKITEYDKKQEILYAKSDHQIDINAAGTFFQDLIRKMGVSEDSVLIEAKKMLENLEISEVNEFQVSLQSGWISKMNHKKIASVSGIKQVESFLFEMKQ